MADMARSCVVFAESAIYSANFSDSQKSSKAIWKVKAKCHTPICSNNCDLTHHELVLALFLDGRCADGKIPRSGDLPAALKQRIESAKLSGWDQNSDVPDPSEELRRPLLFLACAFGKTGIVKALLQNNFDPRAVNQHGQTALHFTAQHLWSYYVEPCRLATKTATTMALDSFERMVKALTDRDPKILSMKDNIGRTALHVFATNINITCINNSPGYRAAHFYQLCLKSMIRRLLKLLDSSLLTRSEVLEIITTPESTHSDSVLHILARNCPYGFHLLQFLQNWLFAGKLPDIENKGNKTVLEIASETNPQAKEIFSRQDSLADGLKLLQERSTQSTQFVPGTLISDNNEVASAPANVGFTEPQAHHSSNLEVCHSLGTENPCSFPEIQSEGDLPYISQVFSLCSEQSLESRSSSDLSNMLENGNMSSNIQIVESYSVSPSPGLNNMQTSNNSFGWDALALVRQNVVGVALTQYSNKLSELEETLPKLDQIIDEAKTVVDQKMARVSMLEKELDLVKRGALEKMKCIDDLRRKKELLREETNRLKRKVEFCQEKQNHFVNHCKQWRSA